MALRPKSAVQTARNIVALKPAGDYYETQNCVKKMFSNFNKLVKLDFWPDCLSTW